MMDERGFDQRRERDGLGDAPLAANDDAGLAVPALIIAAILIVGGYFVVTYNSDTVRTASNTPAAQSAPKP
jgi:hypothetical protein